MFHIVDIKMVLVCLCYIPTPSGLGFLPKTTFFFIYLLFTTSDMMHWGLPTFAGSERGLICFSCLPTQHHENKTSILEHFFPCKTG